MPNDDVQLFSKRLNEAMEMRKMNSRTLAAAAGVTEAAVSRYRKGKFAPKRNTLFKIARTLGVSPTWLLGVSNDMYYVMPEKDRLRNELENLLEDMDQEQIEKLLKFARDYIVK